MSSLGKRIGLIGVSLLMGISVLQPFFTAPAYAAGTDVEDRVRKVLEIYAIANCFNHSGIAKKQSDVVNYNWFSTAPAFADAGKPGIKKGSLGGVAADWSTNAEVGAFVGGNTVEYTGDGSSQSFDNGAWVVCDNSETWLSKYLSDLGYGAVDGMCAAGAKRDGKYGSGCASASGDFEPANDASSTGSNTMRYRFIYNAAKKNGIPVDIKSDGSGLNSITPFTSPQQYWWAINSFIAGCGATNSGEYKDTADQKALIDSHQAAAITTVDPAKGTSKKILYKTTLTTDKNTVAWADKGSWTGTKCSDLASTAESTAGAYAAYVRSNPQSSTLKDSRTSNDNSSNSNGKPSCNVDGIGWIVCPVLNFMAKITDQAYSIVSSMLEVRAFTTEDNDTKSAMFSAWSSFRNIANVCFVFAFLMIIYSQLTSVGLSNFGLKKLLPKLIIAAILVNISYWICAIAVDVSNFAGAALKGFFTGDGVFKIAQPSKDASSTGAGAAGIAGITATVLISSGVILYAGLTALLPVLITALVAIVTTFLVLMMRQALIILLVVISPLAFVAYLLPNTESWFNKWRKLFSTLLLMYPIIAVIFGASALASQIVMASAPTGKDAETGMKIAIQIMGAGISMVPLFLTPIIMRTSGSVLGKFGGMINNPNKGPFDRMRKGAKSFRENSNVNRSLRAMDPERTSMFGRRKFLSYRNNRNAINRGRADQLEELNKKQVAELASSDSMRGEAFRAKVAGDDESKQAVYQARQQSYLASIDPDKLKLDADKAMMASKVSEITLSIKDPSNKITEVKQKLQEAAQNNDSIGARAAQEILMNSGNKGKSALREALMDVDRSSNVGIELRKDIASSGMKNSAADVYQWSVDGDNRTLSDIAKDSNTWAGLSDAQAMGQIGGSMKAAVSSNGFTPERAQSILNARGAESIGSSEKTILENHAKSAQPSAGSAHPATTPPQPTVNSTQAPTKPVQAPETKAAPQSEPAQERAFSSQQVRSMSADNAQRAMDARGGAGALHESDLIAIRNAHGSSEAGRTAKDELARRGMVTPQPDPSRLRDV